jgi:hypothetical protein
MSREKQHPVCNLLLFVPFRDRRPEFKVLYYMFFFKDAGTHRQLMIFEDTGNQSRTCEILRRAGYPFACTIIPVTKIFPG